MPFLRAFRDDGKVKYVNVIQFCHPPVTGRSSGPFRVDEVVETSPTLIFYRAFHRSRVGVLTGLPLFTFEGDRLRAKDSERPHGGLPAALVRGVDLFVIQLRLLVASGPFSLESSLLFQGRVSQGN